MPSMIAESRSLLLDVFEKMQSDQERRNKIFGHKKTPPERGFDRLGTDYCMRVPTTSISTRRFLARPAAVLLSATGCDLPLPSV